MTVLSYRDWVVSIGGTPEEYRALPQDQQEAVRATYNWYKEHPDASEDEQIGRLARELHPRSGIGGTLGDVARKLLSPGENPIWTAGAGGMVDKPAATATADAPPTGPTGAIVATGKGAAADAQSAISALGPNADPGLTQILQGIVAGAPTNANITLWPTLSVDPDANVLGNDYRVATGYGPTGSPTTNQSADAWLKDLYKMGPQQLGELQHRLWEQGWYTGTKVTDPSMIDFGHPDAATLETYGEVLGQTARYNAAGKGLGIDDVIAMGGTSSKSGAEGKGAPFEKTNPADLRSAIRNQAQQDIGRDLSSAEEEQFAGGYLGEEDAARRAIIEANAANRTVGVTGPGTTSGAAEEYIDTHNLADKVAYGAAVRQQAFYSMLKSPV